MIVLQLIVWIVFGAVSFLGIAYLFHAFGKVEDSKTVSVKYASWAIQLFIVVCYLHSVYHFGKWLDAVFFQCASRHGMGRALAPVGALPPYPPKVFFSTPQRETPTSTLTIKNHFPNQENKISIFYLQRIFIYEIKNRLNHPSTSSFLDERIIRHKTMNSTKNPQNRL